MIKAGVEIDNEFIERVNRFPDSIRKQLRTAVEQMSINLTGKVKSEKLSGQVLKVLTGRLRRSISYNMVDTRTKIIGVIGTRVEYAKYHEYRGRSFLRSALKEIKAEARAEMLAAVRRGITDIK